MTTAKPQNATTGICIRSKDDTVSWEELTELLHDAYAQHLKNGLNYAAATQTPAQTKARAEGHSGQKSDTLVAFDNDKLVGTISYEISNGTKWYHGKRYLFFHQFAVLTDCKSKGIGSKFLSYIEEIAKAENCDTVVFDTAESASELIHWCQKRGYVRTSYVSWCNTNYNSIVFTKAFNNKGQFWRKFNFVCSKLSFPLIQALKQIVRKIRARSS